MNSRSARAAPAACASSRPAPTAPRGLVVRCQSAAMPPVARTTARARTGSASPRRGRATSPTQRPSCVVSEVAARGSSTSIRSSTAASADSSRVMRLPVAEPPACTIRRHECPPSRPRARLPWRSASKLTPRRSRSRTRPGDSSHSTRTALSRAMSRPAASVSSMCRSGESSSASAAAIPPCAQNDAVWASGDRLTSATRAPSAAAVSAAYRPAAPAPTTATSTRSGWEALTAGTVPAGVPVYFSHPSSLEHDTGIGHPERADRIRAIEAELGRRDWLGYERREAPTVTTEQLLAVHPKSYIEFVQETCARTGAFDLDTPTSDGTWEAALHAAGGACALVEALLAGESVGVSALRPPGHHAEHSRAMGFCLFANVAIAARYALSHGASRVLVLDWDVHHGNGTNAVFHESREVLFASLHQYPFWPGSGALSDVGAGAGEGYSLNLPVPAGGGQDEYCGLVEHVVVPAARAFDPDLVLVSAGYDAHRADPLGECTMATASYAQLALLIRTLGKPVGYVLEGGYDLGALAASVAVSMECLADGGEPASFPRGELVEQAASVVGRYWELSSPA